jgi:outer membrane receptor protein involved in Fe transport
MDLLSIRETPAINPFDALTFLKGVDVMTSSITFRTLNTRGFNSMANTRFMVRVDGTDIQAPGLNLPIGLLTSPSEMEIKSMELVPGPNSALYGPNAFNGLLNIETKDPFNYPGLSASVKIGANHWDGTDTTLQPYYDFAFRYAASFRNKVGFKIGGKFLKATDWIATNYEDVADYSGTQNLQIAPRGPRNPGYNGVNVYGDEVSAVFHAGNTELVPGFSFLNPGDTLRISRTGYLEKHLFNYGNYAFKLNGGLYYQLNQNTQLEYSGYLTGGTTVYQSGSRYVIQDFRYQNHKVEVKGFNYFLRAYSTIENSGNSYDQLLSAIRINQGWKPDESWFMQYLIAYSPRTNPILNFLLSQQGRDSVRAQDPEAARRFADSDNRSLNNATLHQILRFLGLDTLSAVAMATQLTAGEARAIPGSERFAHLLDSVKAISISNGGSRFVDNTRLYHIEGQYDFSRHWDFIELIAGGSYRYYDLRSNGTIFPDTTQRYFVDEYGAYVQATKRFWDKRIRLTASLRVDKSKNFTLQYSPRLATVFTFGEQRNHNIRIYYQTAFRNPTMQGQYIDLDLGAFRYIGGLKAFDEKYNLILYDQEGHILQNNYTLASVQEFLRTGDSTRLIRANLKPLQPEGVQMAEIGYKVLIQKKLLIDLVAYYGRYKNFIGTLPIVGPSLRDVNTDTAYLTIQDIQRGNYKVYRRYANSQNKVDAYGGSIGLQYALSPKWTLMANYTYAIQVENEDIKRDDLIAGFNTPPHKVNIALTGRKVVKNFGFGINGRWQDDMEFNDGFGKGLVPAFFTLDAQISYLVPKSHLQFKLGGTNILNNRHIEAFGGPTLANLYYFEITLDPFLN